MSRQEFAPEPQEQEGRQGWQEQSAQSWDRAEIYPYKPYHWSTRSKTGDMLKNEHPSTYEGSIPPYSYRAQESASHREQPTRVQPTEKQQRERGQRRQRFSPDGDAFEHGYRPYKNNTVESQVPPWARPQRHNRHVLRWIVLIVLGIVLIKFAVAALAVLAAVIGLTIFALLLPILIIVGIVVAFAILALFVLAALGIPIGIIGYGWFRSRRRRAGPRWGGPWRH